MQNPEVWSFHEVQSSFQINEYNYSDLSVKNFSKLYHNHLVSVILPDFLKPPQSLLGMLSVDCEYYKILKLNPSDLLSIEFLNNFVRQGKLTLLSVGTRIDCDDCIAVTPTGLLTLSLNKDTHQSLGLEGKLSCSTKNNKDRYIITIDLNDSKFQPGTAKYRITKFALDSLPKFDIIFSWRHQDSSICPSSAAKYFSDLQYSVIVCQPALKTHLMYSIETPQLTEAKMNTCEVIDLVEWIGMVSVEGDLMDEIDAYISTYDVPKDNIQRCQVRYVQWRGFYQINQIMELIDFVKNYVCEDNSWGAIYVQGFSDAPLIEDSKEHHYFTNGDNADIFILNKYKMVCCTQRCSAKKYK